MPGKLCTGAATNNAFNPDASKAFSEGMYFRAQGTAAAYPITGNPHDGTGSEDETAWDAGWNVANDAATSTIAATAAPCCAVPTNTIQA